jgi:hypothetical protein
MIEDHDPVATTEGIDVIGEVLLRAPETVHEQEAGPLTGNFDRQLDTVVGDDPHGAMVASRSPRAPGTADVAAQQSLAAVREALGDSGRLARLAIAPGGSAAGRTPRRG